MTDPHEPALTAGLAVIIQCLIRLTGVQWLGTALQSPHSLLCWDKRQNLSLTVHVLIRALFLTHSTSPDILISHLRKTVNECFPKCLFLIITEISICPSLSVKTAHSTILYGQCSVFLPSCVSYSRGLVELSIWGPKRCGCKWRRWYLHLETNKQPKTINPSETQQNHPHWPNQQFGIFLNGSWLLICFTM